MSDTQYLLVRAEQELRAAVSASDSRVREVHLQLADAYAFRVREMQAFERRAELHVAEQPSLLFREKIAKVIAEVRNG